MRNISKKIKEVSSIKKPIKSRNLISNLVIIAFLILILITSTSLFSARLVSAFGRPKTFSIIKEVNGGIGIKFTATSVAGIMPTRITTWGLGDSIGDIIVINGELTDEKINDLSDYSPGKLWQEESVKKSLRKYRTILKEKKKGLRIIKELKIDRDGKLINGTISYPPLEINEKECVSDFIKSDKIGHIGNLIDDKKPEDILASNAEINFATKELDVKKNGFFIMRGPGKEPHEFIFYEALNDGLKVIYNGPGSITLKGNKIIGLNSIDMEYGYLGVGEIKKDRTILSPLPLKKQPSKVLIKEYHFVTRGYFFYKPPGYIGQARNVFIKKGKFDLLSGMLLSLSRNGKRERCMYAKDNKAYWNLKGACDAQVAFGTPLTLEDLDFFLWHISTKNINILRFENLDDIKKRIHNA